jgi:hypothetical protein
METYDVCIVGAGVVGCAIAREFGLKSPERPLRVVVVEQHERAGEETSSRNSGVLHSGNPRTSPFAESSAGSRGKRIGGVICGTAWHPVAQNGNGHRRFMAGRSSGSMARDVYATTTVCERLEIEHRSVSGHAQAAYGMGAASSQLRRTPYS